MAPSTLGVFELQTHYLHRLLFSTANCVLSVYWPCTLYHGSCDTSQLSISYAEHSANVLYLTTWSQHFVRRGTDAVWAQRSEETEALFLLQACVGNRKSNCDRSCELTFNHCFSKDSTIVSSEERLFIASPCGFMKVSHHRCDDPWPFWQSIMRQSACLFNVSGGIKWTVKVSVCSWLCDVTSCQSVRWF